MRFHSFLIHPSSGYRSTARVTRSESRSPRRYKESRMVQPFCILSTAVHPTWFTGSDFHDSGTAPYCLYVHWYLRPIVWAAYWNQPNTGKEAP